MFIQFIIFGLLLAVVYSDVRYRKIPNALNVVIFLACLALWLTHGQTEVDGVLLVYVILTPVLFFLFAKGLVGGGDVKFILAVAVSIPFHALGLFFLVSGVAGGLAAIVIILQARFLGRPLDQMSVPYGVALALATALVLARDIS